MFAKRSVGGTLTTATPFVIAAKAAIQDGALTGFRLAHTYTIGHCDRRLPFPFDFPQGEREMGHGCSFMDDLVPDLGFLDCGLRRNDRLKSPSS